jgi:hypothetical protein
MGVAACLLAGVGGISLVLSHGKSTEPVYKGKRLSVWLEEGSFPQKTEGAAAAKAQAEEAVRQIGTNAIPTLLQMFNRGNSVVGRKVEYLRRKLHLTSGYEKMTPASRANLAAQSGLRALGTNAAGAVPGLCAIYDRTPSDFGKLVIAEYLQSLGPHAKAAIPSLLRSVVNTNIESRARLTAIGALMTIHADLEKVVPAVIKSLNDANSDVRSQAIECLRQFGKDARAAGPALVKLLKDPNQDVRAEATRALKTIDPELAAKSGVE